MDIIMNLTIKNTIWIAPFSKNKIENTLKILKDLFEIFTCNVPQP